MRFSVNISTIFTEIPFLSRFEKARKAGFHYVECQFPYHYRLDELEEKLAKNNLSMTLLNCPPGNWEAGDRGLAADRNRIDEFEESVERSITYAKRLKVKQLHCMAGIIPLNQSIEETRMNYINNITYAAKKMSSYGITLLIEPINSYDMSGYFLSSLDDALDILKEIAMENVKLQFDFYHIQRMHGNLIANFQQNIEHIAHIQVADCPKRHEPGTGEINYSNIFRTIQASGYDGFIGLEYTPETTSEDSFTWLTRWR
ncbi:TIM barrel protein [Robertmurraya sp. DFI.2.37]|uniref:hydroxypyruvate isomerase family protein n=1 Tax=Robertmurraya sp. DFI.2.37 TaxID=3031819 RepID=UPI0023DAFBC8|nr:TIM barrel protein [Robertmurraya sp. DFI.2.37]MDF1510323.1 TIM barrel protein [Robertmurraya sp. DFI.2.37]